MTIYETITELKSYWNEDGITVSDFAIKERKPMSINEFLDNCSACGGNWGGMFLTGIQRLFPQTYEAIPDDMGIYAFNALCDVLFLCGVEWSD